MPQTWMIAYPQGKMKAFTLSYDDGVDSDARLVELMRRYRVKGTFNINTGICPKKPVTENRRAWNRMTLDTCVKLYGDDMEIAVHGVHHSSWNKIPTSQAMAEILDDKRALEQATGKPVLGGAYPNGGFHDDVVRILQLAGIRYCRVTGGTKKLTVESPDWLRFQGTCAHKDPQLMELAQAFVQDQPDTVYLFYVWGHTYEFVQKDNWDVMEQLLALVSGREDVWYATNIEIVSYLQAAQQLTEENGVFRNPTDTDVWVRQGAQAIRIPAGENAGGV